MQHNPDPVARIVTHATDQDMVTHLEKLHEETKTCVLRIRGGGHVCAIQKNHLITLRDSDALSPTYINSSFWVRNPAALHADKPAFYSYFMQSNLPKFLSRGIPITVHTDADDDDPVLLQHIAELNGKASITPPYRITPQLFNQVLPPEIKRPLQACLAGPNTRDTAPFMITMVIDRIEGILSLQSGYRAWTAGVRTPVRLDQDAPDLVTRCALGALSVFGANSQMRIVRQVLARLGRGECDESFVIGMLRSGIAIVSQNVRTTTHEAGIDCAMTALAPKGASKHETLFMLANLDGAVNAILRHQMGWLPEDYREVSLLAPEEYTSL